MSSCPDDEFLDEYQAVTQDCGYFPLENWTSIRVTGADRRRFLHNMCTNEISKLSDGEGCETFFTNVKGKIVAHTFVMVLPDEILLLTVPNQAEQIIEHLDRYVIREDVQLLGESNQNVWRAILGAQANQLACQITENIKQLERPWQSISFETGELIGTIARFDAVTPKGFLIRCTHSTADNLADLLKRSAVKQVSEPVWTSLRVEAGFPLFGVDFDSSNLPQEVGRNRQAISFTKGCYLGQETIARLDALGHVNKQIVAMQFAGEMIPPSDTKIFDGEKEVGTITASSWSPKLKSPLALAMVRRGSNEIGKKLRCELGEVTVVQSNFCSES